MAEYMSKKDVIAYIRKEAEECQNAFDELGGESGIIAEAFEDLANELEDFPAADVAPVRHGLWKPVHASEATGWNPQFAGSDPIWGYICTVCRNEAIYDCNDEHVLSDYCPNCGARMARMDGAK